MMTMNDFFLMYIESNKVVRNWDQKEINCSLEESQPDPQLPCDCAPADHLWLSYNCLI